ncbi:hypothetical protein SAMN04244572_02363 [Azotobacter beijerinckii]|uniref:Uncharacterized protein n=1 Tax=Azotobacter beijerinckii TaxID=170623 RepID=A0A1H6VGJ8_9GAMM|nr:hypothetical protein [Azotobacter beijerinckii]SEI99335.1 hypothetical protein SAMN04244572_02363 [Azotobacter beijerinckii]
MSQSFKSRLNAIKQTHSYQVEKAKLEFIRGITRVMKLKGISSAALASKIATSKAYTTKALRGDTNFTIDSMVKLAGAVGAQLYIHVADTTASVRWLEVHPCAGIIQDKGISNPFETPSIPHRMIDMQGIFKEISNEKSQIYA